VSRQDLDTPRAIAHSLDDTGGITNMRGRTIAGVIGVVVVMWALPLAAHHSWNSVFSEDKPLVLRGTLNKVEMVNPHGWIWIDVTAADGTVTKWGIEGGPPNNLIRNGITKDTLKVGEPLVVHGYGSRDGSNTLAGVRYERADGKQFFLANDGAEAVAKARGNLK
jgi:hypothetical protein